MWSDFTVVNYKELKTIKKKYIVLDSIFYNKIQLQLLNFINHTDIPFNINLTKISKTKLNELIDSNLVYNDVKNKINKLTCEYLITWDNNKIYLKCTLDKFNKITKRLNHLIKMINFIKGLNPDGVTIYLLLTKLKKKINGTSIKPKHINSGYTSFINGKSDYIFVWRDEEFEKVLFHELIHFYKLDHSNENYSNNSPNYLLYEAITDFKAIIYNLIYLASITKVKLYKLMNYEFSFMNNQGILFSELLKKNIKTKSPLYAYYILKPMLMQYIISNDFSDNEYNDLFINHIGFNKLIYKLKSLNENKYIDFNSSRMSFLELE